MGQSDSKGQDLKADALLEVAFGAQRWIEQFADDTAHGRRWGLAQERPDKYIYTLYAGAAGIMQTTLCLPKNEQLIQYRQ